MADGPPQPLAGLTIPPACFSACLRVSRCFFFTCTPSLLTCFCLLGLLPGSDGWDAAILDGTWPCRFPVTLFCWNPVG